jgi:ribosomal-protein-alanine N-acetyltransferase
MCSEREFRNYLSDPSHHGYVCQIGGEVRGYMLVTVFSNLYRLDNLVVYPDYRRQGVGRSLIADIWHRGEGRKWVDAELVDSSAEAIAFFRSVGFRDIGRKKRWSALDWMSPVAKFFRQRQS